MKKLLLSFLLFPFLSQAQIVTIDSVKAPARKPVIQKMRSQKLYSYSLGVKLFSYEELPQILNQVNNTNFQREYVSGFIFKFNDNQISYRVTGNFFSDDVAFKNDCEECEEAKGKLRDNALRLGFEKNIIYGNVQPYFGFDLGYRRNSFKGSSSNATSLNYTTPYDVKTQKNGFSISPLVGIKFNVIDHITIAAESSLDLLYSYEKQERAFRDGNFTRTVNNYSKWEFLLRPVGLLTLQYNFAEKY
ncbi:hypothetical protein [Desertivirga brevis]|uniref:hypothetical protein n=1 Tax=Desertivirga brevis TaxID=2810310 RepID=UPI001A96D7E6|nr:hypothetical protein [Pedobacter sp. SYSU D00873]